MPEVVDTIKKPVFHIVEEPGGDRMTEVEIPPEYYYQKLREDLGQRHPAAGWHVLLGCVDPSRVLVRSR